MSAEEAMQILTRLEEIEKQNSKQVETLRKRGEEAKEVILKHLTSNNLPYLSNGSQYLVPVRKKIKAPLNEELVRIVYRAFRSQVSSNHLSEEEVDAFMSKIEEARIKLGGVTVKLVKSKTKPLASLVL